MRVGPRNSDDARITIGIPKGAASGIPKHHRMVERGIFKKGSYKSRDGQKSVEHGAASRNAAAPSVL